MALATRCPNCHALFRVAADQLKLRGGLVRCGACQHVFDAIGTLSYIDDATLPTSAQMAAPAVGAVIAAIRKAESAAGESLSVHGTSGLPPAPTSAAQEFRTPPAAPTPATEAAADTDVPAIAMAAGETSIPGDAAPGEPTPTDVVDETPTEPAAAAESLLPAEPTAPAFLSEGSRQRKRARTALFAGGVLFLALLLLAQLAVAFRAELLAKFPQARPALSELCKVFRCTVNWPARGDLLAVVGSELQALPGTSAFELTAVVRNRGSMTLALPAIELTLSDTLNRTVARKVFVPTDYLAGEGDPQRNLIAGLEAGADLTVRIAFEARGVNAAGFVVYPFYF